MELSVLITCTKGTKEPIYTLTQQRLPMIKQSPKERFAAKVDDLSWRTHRIGFVAHLFHFIFVPIRHGVGGQKGKKGKKY